MTLFSLLLLAVALSMDAFAVSICKGLCTLNPTPKYMITIGLWFGVFQGIMPLIGYFIGISFASLIISIAPWIAFSLLLLLGIKMIKDSFSKDSFDKTKCDVLNHKNLFLLSLATSIDALAVGFTFICIPVVILKNNSQTINTILASMLITLISGFLSVIGVKIGNIFGAKYKGYAEFAGGLILMLIGFQILREHLL